LNHPHLHATDIAQVRKQLSVVVSSSLCWLPFVTDCILYNIMADVANLEAAFERTTITDENDEQIASTSTYHKAKVCHMELNFVWAILTPQSHPCPRLYR
jgi:hypothetical protein